MKGQRTINKLIKQSQSAFLLGVQLYNTFNNDYRLEGFVFFICNAWELLLKAKIISNTQRVDSIYYNDSKNSKDKRTLTLGDCIKKVFSDENNHVRKNLETVRDIRDMATHFYIPETESITMGILQSNVISYTRYLNRWFDNDISDKISPGMIAFSTPEKPLDIIALKHKYPKDIFNNFTNLEKKIRLDKEKYNDNNFYVSSEYKFTLSKKRSDSDITFFVDPNSDKGVVFVDKPKDVNVNYPLRTKDIIEKLNSHFKTEIYTQHKVLKMINYEGFKKDNNEMHYKMLRPTVHCYSSKILDFFINKLTKNKNYLEKCLKK